MQLVGEESRAQRPARDVILARLLEVLLIEALRSSAANTALPGLVRGLADERLAAALRQMHENPTQPWTVAQLAKAAALSRSALFERFSSRFGGATSNAALAPERATNYEVGWKTTLANDTLRFNGALFAEEWRDFQFSFLGLNGQGRVSIVRTSGNPHGHVVLRGGDGRPNYDTVSVAMAEQALTKAKLPANVVVDCSHANSYKKPELQPLVMADVINQVVNGNKALVGVMIESNIVAGNQAIPDDLSQLKYGCSVTDACVDWATTETMIREAAEKLRVRKA